MTDMSESAINFRVADQIARIELNQPETRNAITDLETIEAVESACRTVNEDMTINVMVITGADPAFSSGGNIKDMQAKSGMFAGPPAAIMENYRRYVQRIPLAVCNVAVPTIAAVNGPAMGAGCDLTLMCDMRIASERARFGETFLNVGLIPGDGGAYFLPRVVGMARACEMTFTGKIVDAQEALNIGLVNQVVPHEDLMAETLKLAASIAAKPGPALRMAKRLLYQGRDTSLQQLLDQSAACQALCHHTDDHAEALTAIFEKRPPRFTGN